jgi:hypothetical protein
MKPEPVRPFDTRRRGLLRFRHVTTMAQSRVGTTDTTEKETP